MASARLPADHGLSGLGLVMQLGGGMFAVLTAQIGFSQLVLMSRMDGGGKGWLFLLTLFGVVRSIAHSVAGKELVSGDDGRTAVRRYLWIAAAHTAMWLFYASSEMRAADESLLTIGLLFGAWPLALGASILFGLLPLPEGRLVVTRDRGFDGLGCLMAVLGAGGLLYGVVMALAFLEMSDRGDRGFEFQALMGIVILLIVRSAIHVRAAIHTLSARDLDRSTEAASRYGNAGVITTGIVGFLLVVMMMKAGGAGVMLLFLMVGAVFGMLMVWPLAVRRFVTERRFGYEGDNAGREQRSTDGGMSSLGWLLLAFGAMTMATALPAALRGAGAERIDGVLTMFAADTRGSPWLLVAVAGLQLWAAVELCAASARSRGVAMLYGATATAITLWMHFDTLRHLGRLGAAFGQADGMGALASLALTVVVPATTFFLALRPQPPLTPDVARVFE